MQDGALIFIAGGNNSKRGAGGKPVPLKDPVFLVFLVFLKRCSPATAGLSAMEHQGVKAGTLRVQNTKGVLEERRRRSAVWRAGDSFGRSGRWLEQGRDVRIEAPRLALAFVLRAGRR